MYELHRIYTGIANKYSQGIGWVSAKTDVPAKTIVFYELNYIDLDDNGKIHYTGTEDFSSVRFKQLVRKYVTVKSGYEKKNPTLKTKLGWNIIDERVVYVNKEKDVRAFYKMLRKNYSEHEYLKVGA